MKTFQSKLKDYPVTFFFLFAFLFSWVLWIPLLYGHFALGWASWEGDAWSNYKTLLGLLGSLGPSLSAIVMTYVLHGKTEVKSLLKKVIQWRVHAGWWFLSLYGWWILCSVVAFFLQVKDLHQISFNLLISLINIPGLVFTLQLPLLIGVFGEEVGWRGFALPQLLKSYNPLWASLIIAVPWIFWHAPLAVFQEWRLNTSIFQFFLNYILLVTPLSIVFTWFFQKTKGSLLLVMLLHKSLNLTFNAYKLALGLDDSASASVRQWSIGAIWVFAILIGGYYLFFYQKKELGIVTAE